MMLNVGFGSRLMAGVSGMCSHWFPAKNSMFVFTSRYWFGTSPLLYARPRS